jgi:phenylalanyl-tRNA synthetase alpha chain
LEKDFSYVTCGSSTRLMLRVALRRSLQTAAKTAIDALKKDEWANVSSAILDKLGRNLHNTPKHPLNLIKTKIENSLMKIDPAFLIMDSMSPVVTTKQNFDDLLIPKKHVNSNI